MLISAKQLSANRENAEKSTGPRTPEGKARVRLNALRYGLRARSLLITGEDPEEYHQLHTDLESEWQPRNRTERLQLEQMVISQWLLARNATGEASLYRQEMRADKQMALLDRFSTQRARLERSYNTAVHELERLKKKPALPDAQPEVAPIIRQIPQYHGHMTSDEAPPLPVICSPADADTR